MQGRKLGSSEKLYGSDCLEVRGGEEGGVVAESQDANLGHCTEDDVSH